MARAENAPGSSPRPRPEVGGQSNAATEVASVYRIANDLAGGSFTKLDAAARRNIISVARVMASDGVTAEVARAKIDGEQVRQPETAATPTSSHPEPQTTVTSPVVAESPELVFSSSDAARADGNATGGNDSQSDSTSSNSDSGSTETSSSGTDGSSDSNTDTSGSDSSTDTGAGTSGGETGSDTSAADTSTGTDTSSESGTDTTSADSSTDSSNDSSNSSDSGTESSGADGSGETSSDTSNNGAGQDSGTSGTDTGADSTSGGETGADTAGDTSSTDANAGSDTAGDSGENTTTDTSGDQGSGNTETTGDTNTDSGSSDSSDSSGNSGDGGESGGVQPKPDVVEPQGQDQQPQTEELVQPGATEPEPQITNPDQLEPQPQEPEVKPESVEPVDPVQPDSETTEPVQPEPEATDPVRPEPETIGPIQPDQESTNPVKPEPEIEDPIQPELESIDPVEPDPESTDLVRTEPDQQEPTSEPEPQEYVEPKAIVKIADPDNTEVTDPEPAQPNDENIETEKPNAKVFNPDQDELVDPNFEKQGTPLGDLADTVKDTIEVIKDKVDGLDKENPETTEPPQTEQDSPQTDPIEKVASTPVDPEQPGTGEPETTEPTGTEPEQPEPTDTEPEKTDTDENEPEKTDGNGSEEPNNQEVPVPVLNKDLTFGTLIRTEDGLYVGPGENGPVYKSIQALYDPETNNVAIVGTNLDGQKIFIDPETYQPIEGPVNKIIGLDNEKVLVTVDDPEYSGGMVAVTKDGIKELHNRDFPGPARYTEKIDISDAIVQGGLDGEGVKIIVKDVMQMDIEPRLALGELMKEKREQALRDRESGKPTQTVDKPQESTPLEGTPEHAQSVFDRYGLDGEEEGEPIRTRGRFQTSVETPTDTHPPVGRGRGRQVFPPMDIDMDEPNM